MAMPMPDVAPVTNAVIPFNDFMPDYARFAYFQADCTGMPRKKGEHATLIFRA
jgi:hypothetical protein